MVGLDRFKEFADLFPYTIPYFMFVILIFFILYTKKFVKHSLLFDSLIIILFIIFAGLKEPFTEDLRNYCYMYHNKDILSITWIEPFMIFSVHLLNTITSNCLALFIWYQFLTVLFITLSINKIFKSQIDKQIWAWFVYISLPFLFLNSFGVEIRQVLALSIFLYGTTFLYVENSLKKYLIFSILASLAHYSAILGSLFLLIAYSFLKLLNPKIVTLILLLLLPFGLLFSNFFLSLLSTVLSLSVNIFPFLNKYQNYLVNPETTPLIKSLIYLLIPTILGLISMKAQDDAVKMSVNLTLIGTLFLLVFRDFAPASRIAYYFLIMQVIIFPNLIKIIKPRFFVGWILALFLSLQFLYGLYYITPNGNFAFLPYKGLILEVFK
jgi:hypothetical protein